MAATGPAAGLSRPRAPLRRLSSVQYNNTVRDLLGDQSRPADRFIGNEVAGDFVGTASYAQVSPLLVEQYRSAAETLAAAAVKNLAILVPCATQDEACARSFIDSFGLRAFRRPLTAQEATALLDVYRGMRASGDFALAIQTIVQITLQSPHFLYRVELVPAGAAVGAVVPLGPYQMAARLSYFLWNTMPDRELFDAAKAGKLATVSDIAGQVRRMLADPRARDATTEFFRYWLELDELDSEDKAQNQTPFPVRFADVRGSMREETMRFARYVIFDADGRLDTLLTAPRSMVNPALAKLYGVPMQATDFALVELNPAQRAGVLTQASVLAVTSHEASTSPTLRGKFVRQQVMCQIPPPPPPAVNTSPPAPMPGQTARARYTQHVADPNCRVCHELMDPIGFGFENYDPYGMYRTTDAGKPVDASGEVLHSQDIDGPFSSATELSKKLARSAQVRDCMIEKWFEFAQGKDGEAGDQPSLKVMRDVFTASDGSLRELMSSITRTDAFSSRLVEAAQ